MPETLLSPTAIIHPNVQLGDRCRIEDFAIVGAPPCGKEPGELKTIIGDNAIIRSHTVIYAGNTIGNNFQTGNKANIRECNTIGNNVSIGTLSVVEHHVILEDGVRIHTQVFISEYCVLETGCWIGPNVVFTNAKYPNRPDTKSQLQGCTIRRSAVIGANSTLLPGVVIGEKAVVGAASTIIRNVSAHETVKGLVK